MDRTFDIDGEEDAAAEPTLSELAAMLGRLVEYIWKRETAKRIALHCRQLDALRSLISRIALLMLLALRLIARWVSHAADVVTTAIVNTLRHLHHPPQAWAAP